MALVGTNTSWKTPAQNWETKEAIPLSLFLVISRAGSFAVAFFHLVHWIKSCSFLSRSATRLFKRRRKKALTSDRVSYLVIPVQGKIFKALSVGRIERMSTDANEKGKLRASTQRALITIAVKARTSIRRECVNKSSRYFLRLVETWDDVYSYFNLSDLWALSFWIYVLLPETIERITWPLNPPTYSSKKKTLLRKNTILQNTTYNCKASFRVPFDRPV